MSPPITDSVLHDVAVSNQNFATDMYGVLAEGSENIIFSPISIQLVLMMLYLGARGKTALELSSGLHMPSDKTGFLEGVRLYSGYLTKKSQINLATGLFIDKGFNITQEYKRNTKHYFDSELHLLNYYKENEAARQYINDWVSKQTHNKIKDLFAPRSIDPETVLVLANAIYFKELWKTKFLEQDTIKLPFHLLNGQTTPVNMMRNTNQYLYTDTTEYQAVELPYTDEDFSMVIVLPTKSTGLKELEKHLPSVSIANILKNMKSEKVSLTIPKFKLEKGVDLNDALKKLGMKNMFDAGELSGISETGPLGVSKVVHKGFIEVTEEGVKAAAATGIEIVPYSFPPPSDKKTFHAKRPFLFYIVNKPKNILLFMGRFVSP